MPIPCEWREDSRDEETGITRRVIVILDPNCPKGGSHHHMQGDPNDPTSTCKHCGEGYDQSRLKD